MARALGLLLLLSSSESLRLPSASSISRRAALAGALAAAPPLAANAAGAIRAGDQGSVGADGRVVLNDPNAGSINVLTSPAKVTSRCYLDISVGGASAGRIVIDLYGEIAPKTAENFRQLCSGEAGFGYAGSSFFKVVSELTLQAGAVEGHGSIYGPTFPHENYDIKHNVAGMVSMVNSGVGGSSGLSDSRFLVQLADDAGYLDGRYVAFSSGGDVLLRDRVAGTTTTVTDGGNAASGAPSISSDGRYVAYETLATDLTTDGVAGVLRWDRTTGDTELVSTTSAGAPATGGRSRHPQLDADGSVVAFESRSDDLGADGTSQVYVKDLASGATTLVSQVAGVPGDRLSTLARLSADGSRVLFSSDADLVADDEDRYYCEHEVACYDDEYRTDAYVADVVGGAASAVTLVSRTSSGEASDFYSGGQDLTADGGQALFVSRDVLVPGQGSRGQLEEIYLDVFVRDLS